MPLFHCLICIHVGFSFLFSPRFFHLNDSRKAAKKGDAGYDPLYKVRPLIDAAKKTFISTRNALQRLSVDESMIGFKGRLSWKQYMPMKPTKWGMKVWTLCESLTGYCFE